MAWGYTPLNLQNQPQVSGNWAEPLMRVLDDNREQKKAADILLARRQATQNATGPDGKFNAQNAAQFLLGQGDLEGGKVYGQFAENEADRDWRRQEAERAQRNADRSYGLEAQRAGRERQPNVVEIYDAKGMPQKGILNADGSFTPLGGAKAPRTAAGLTVTDKKAILEADAGVMSGNNVIDALTQAERLNESAYSGGGADARSYVGSTLPDWMVPGDKQRATDTQQLKTLVTSQALDQLKSTFGSMPTEGERKILLEIQGSVDQAPQVRAEIFKRAKALAEKRVEFNRRQGQGLRDGSYYTDEGGNMMQEAGARSSAPQQPQPQQFNSGQRAVNPTTGQTIEYRNGSWVPVQ